MYNTIPLALMSSYGFPLISTMLMICVYYSQRKYTDTYVAYLNDRYDPIVSKILGEGMHGDRLIMHDNMVVYERMRLLAVMSLSGISVFNIHNLFRTSTHIATLVK